MITFSPVIIHAVHGTWPYGSPTWQGRRRTSADWTGAERPWFEPGSAFATTVMQDRSLTWVPFEWSGDNSFTARQEAIDAFHACLCTSLAASGAAPHAIVAHSHGGTVALAAVARLRAEQQARIAGIVTMGTPFATLKYATSSTFGVAQGVLEYAGALSPFVVALCTAIVWSLGSDRVILHAVALSAVAWLAVLAWMVSALPRLIAWRSGPRPYAFDLFKTPDSVQPPLVALRASGDEATLAIASAQALRLATRVAFQTFPVSVTDNQLHVRSWLTKSCQIAFVLSFVGALVRLALQHRNTAPGIAPLDIATVAQASVAVVIASFDTAARLLALLVFALALGTALLACLATASAFALARATGRESWDLIAQVECEPVPSGVRAVLETLALEKSDETRLASGGVMRHSFHELPTARARVAALIADWLAPAGDETRALNEGGRARGLVFDRWTEAHQDLLRRGGHEALQEAQGLVGRALASAGPVAAFQLVHRLRPLFPEADHSALDSLAIDIRFSEIQAGLADIGRELGEL